MNIIFWISLIAMLFVAIGILVLPLVRVSSYSSFAYKDSNLGLYKSKLSELEIDLEEGRIDKDHYTSAVAELGHELLADVPAENVESASPSYGVKSKPRPVTAMMVAIFLPAFALLLYMQLGMHAESNESTAQNTIQGEPQENINLMVEKLADQLYRVGGSVEEWSMLGRAFKLAKRYAESSKAFDEAIKQQPDARLYLEQAEALALLNGQSFAGRPRELVLKALELAPDNVNVLWFAGVAEFQSGNYGESVDFLVRLSAEAKQDAEINQSIRFYLIQAREKLIAQGVDIPTVDELLDVDRQDGSETTGVVLTVHVDINSKIRELFSDNTVVFVYAKAKDGPKMPLAVQRLILSDLPTTVILDDTMAMVAGMNISAFDSVSVSARVSKTGSAIARAGDYIASIIVDDVLQAGELNVIISEVVK